MLVVRGDRAGRGADVEHPARPDALQPRGIGSGILAGRLRQPHEVARRKPERPLDPARLAARESVWVRSHHLMRAAPLRRNAQRPEPGADRHLLARCAHASGIDPMVFGVALPHPIEFGAPTGTTRE